MRATALIAMITVGCSLGVDARGGEISPERLHTIVDRITTVGGRVSGSEKNPTGVVRVDFKSGATATDADMALLAEIKTIEIVELPEAATDKTLEALRGLPSLRQLVIHDCHV